MSTEQTQSSDSGKMVAIVSYLTWIGWIIAFILHNNKKTNFGAFHLRQSGLIMIIFLILSLLSRSLAKSPSATVLGLLFGIISIGLLILTIMGIIRAANGDTKPLPFIGDYAQKLLAGIQ